MEVMDTSVDQFYKKVTTSSFTLLNGFCFYRCNGFIAFPKNRSGLLSYAANVHWS